MRSWKESDKICEKFKMIPHRESMGRILYFRRFVKGGIRILCVRIRGWRTNKVVIDRKVVYGYIMSSYSPYLPLKVKLKMHLELIFTKFGIVYQRSKRSNPACMQAANRYIYPVCVQTLKIFSKTVFYNLNLKSIVSLRWVVSWKKERPRGVCVFLHPL